MTDKVSVITPVFNMERYLGDAIRSVLDQTHLNFELILIDDCSTDGSMEIMQAFAREDDRVRILSTPVNSWAHTAGNVGLDHATGDFVAVLDADDILPKDRFSRQLEHFSASPDIGVCGGWMKHFGDSDKTIDSFQTADLDIRLGMLFDSTMGHGTAMIRRHVIEDHDIRYDTSIFYAHDYHFFTQLAFDAGATFANMPEVVYLYRWHAGQTSVVRRAEQIGYSDEVRKTVLARFDLSDSALVETHLHICHKQPYLIEEPIERLTQYFEAMVAGNRDRGIFPDRAFRTYLATKICGDMRRCGLAGLGFYRRFPYRDETAWSGQDKFRFFVRALRPSRGPARQHR